MPPQPRKPTLLLTAHIIVTVAALGSDLALLALAGAGLRGVDPRAVYPAAHLLGQWVLAPLAVASLATGLLMAATTRWTPFRHGWVTIKGSITVVLIGLLLGSLVPGLARAAAAAIAAPGAGPITHAQQVLLAAAPAAAVALLTLNIILGAYKPRLHRRAARRPDHPALTTPIR